MTDLTPSPSGGNGIGHSAVLAVVCKRCGTLNPAGLDKCENPRCHSWLLHNTGAVKGGRFSPRRRAAMQPDVDALVHQVSGGRRVSVIRREVIEAWAQTCTLRRAIFRELEATDGPLVKGRADALRRAFQEARDSEYQLARTLGLDDLDDETSRQPPRSPAEYLEAQTSQETP